MAATITISTIGNQTANTPFKVSGTYRLDQGTWTDVLQYSTDKSAGSPLPAIVSTVGQANWSFTHPGLAPGLHTVTVKDPFTGASVTSNQFQVLGAKTINVTTPIATVTQGTALTINGTLGGYQTAPTLSYKLDTAAPVVITGSIGSATTTAFTLTITAPASGSHTITIIDGAISSPAVSFMTNPPVAARAIAINPISTTTVGASFTLSGNLTSYPTPPALTYKVDSGNAVAMSGNTATSFSIQVVAPSPAGVHTVAVSDGTITATASFTTVAAKSITIFNPGTVNAGQSFTFQGSLTGFTTIPGLTYQLDGGSVSSVTGVTVSGWSMTLTAPSATGSHTLTVTDGTITATPVTFTVQAVPPPTVLRQWWQNPGQDGSFWVQPFDRNASWITSGSLLTTLRNGSNASPTGHLHLPDDYAPPWYVGGPSDPIVKVTDGTKTIFVRVPLGAVLESPGDFAIGGADTTQPYLLWNIGQGTVMTDANGNVISSVQASGTTITGTLMCVEDGSGIIFEDQINGQNGSNNSIGYFTEYELSQALADPNYVVQHMIPYALDASQMSNQGPIWPLRVIDTSFPNTGGVPQGLTIGIPQNAVYPSAKVGNRAFKLLWDNLQQFGWFFYNQSGNGCLSTSAYPRSSATTTFATAMAAEMNAIMAYVCILQYTSGVAGAQYSLDTMKGKLPGVAASPAYNPPPPLDYTPTGGTPVLPSTFGAWYPSGYNVKSVPSGGVVTPPGGGTTTVSWNPSDASLNIVLSNNNLTATTTGSTTAGASRGSVRATNAVLNDPNTIVVWEVTGSTLTQNWATGVADSSFVLDVGGGLGSDAHGVGYYPSTGPNSQPAQTVYFNNAQLTGGNGVTSVNGDTVSIATRGSQIWFSDAAMRSTSGVSWNGSATADPVTGVGGFDLTGIGTPFYPIANDVEGGGVFTLNDGSTAFSAFLSGYMTSHSTANIKKLNGATTVITPGSRVISPNTPTNVVAGSSFPFTGSLSGYNFAPNLTYQIDNGSFQPLPGLITSGTAGVSPIFADEFTSLNVSDNGSLTTWMNHYAFGNSEYTLSWNNEAEYYASSTRTPGFNPFSIVNNQLVITANSVANTVSNPLGLPYNSGALVSATEPNSAPGPGLFNGSYFYVEWRAKLPKGRGLWPAFWLEPTTAPWAGEIDVMEALGHDVNTIYQTLHGNGVQFTNLSPSNVTLVASTMAAVTLTDYSANFHTYGFGWDANTMTWYLDGVATVSCPTQAPFQTAQSNWYLLMNLAVGGTGSWSGPPDGSTVFPAQMIVDYVRVYNGTSPPSGETFAATGWSTTLSISGVGTHVINVTDGTITGSTSPFAVSSSGGTGNLSRVPAPLTGTVTAPRSWLSFDQNYSGVTMGSGKPFHFNVLLPSGYDPTKYLYPVLFWLHPDFEGTDWYTGANSDPTYLVGADAEGFYNNTSFSTNYPAIIVVPYCDQSGGNDAVENWGGWVNTGVAGSGTVSSGDTGPNVFALLETARLLTSGGLVTPSSGGSSFVATGDPNRVYTNGFSLGGIGTEYLMRMYNQVNGSQKLFTAGVSFAGVLEINGFGAGPNAADISASTSPPLWAVSGQLDGTSVPGHWNLPLWRSLAGNSNYPTSVSTSSASRAGSSNYYLSYIPGLGHDQSTYPTNTTLLSWLFSQFGNTTPTTPTITGVNLSKSTVAGTSAVGTVVGALSATASGGTLNGTSFAMDPNAPSAGGTGRFEISGGKIWAPNGSRFIVHGINADPVNQGISVSNILALFPNCNFVRWANGSQNAPSYYQNFINQATAAGIVVEIELHQWPIPPPATGSALTTEANWYASLASAYKNNPYVWFGTPNEPQSTLGMAAITAEQVAVYNAIRNTGADNIVLLEAGGGGGNPGETGIGALTPTSAYSAMTRVCWDLHYYGWMTNFSTDQNTVNAKLLGSAASSTGIAALQPIKSVDGDIPIIIAEFGESTNGSTTDANWEQDRIAVTVWALQTNGYTQGYAAWQWNPGSADILVSGGARTWYGDEINSDINSARTFETSLPPRASSVLTIPPPLKADLLTKLGALKAVHAISGQSIGARTGDITAINSIATTTGKTVGTLAIDYFGSGATPTTSSTAGNAAAINHWNAGGLVLLNLGFANPQTGGDLSDTTIDANATLTTGTSQNTTLAAMVDAAIAGIRALSNAGVCPVVRPFPRANGPFWWGGFTDAQFVSLWQFVVNRIAGTGLTNVLYAWSIASGAVPTARYPGDSFVDIVAWDFFSGTANDASTYSALNSFKSTKPIAITEFGPGTTSVAPGYTETTFVANLKASMPNVVIAVHGSGIYGLDRLSGTSAALGDSYIFNQGQFNGSTNAASGNFSISGANLTTAKTPLTAGSYAASIRVSASNASNSPQSFFKLITVT